MDEERPPRLAPRLVLFLVGAFVLLTVLGWILGAVLNALRFLALLAICVAVIWAITSSKGRD